MDDLSPGQLDALRNLGRKSAGNDTAFVNIADARQLTELGLATRSRQGWDITAAGAAYLASRQDNDGDEPTPSNIHEL
jgi:hypothetical protein